jgi:integrase
MQWMLYSIGKNEDELLSRYCDKNRKKTVIRKDVRYAIKDTLTEMGLPPKHFSNKSLRSGFTTHVIANGMENDKMKGGGGWTVSSQVPNNRYTHQTKDRGAFALAGSDEEKSSVSKL